MTKPNLQKHHVKSAFERLEFPSRVRAWINRNNQSQATRAAVRAVKDKVNLRYDDEGDEFFNK